jgi:TPR repeat protein
MGERLKGKERISDTVWVNIRLLHFASPVRAMLGVLIVCGMAVPVFSQGLSAGMATSDVAEIRKKAEAGAEAAFGDVLSFKTRYADALIWYRKAAMQGNVKAQAHVAGMLLWGYFGNPNDQTVRPDRAEGIRWVFMAATNHDLLCAILSYSHI